MSLLLVLVGTLLPSAHACAMEVMPREVVAEAPQAPTHTLADALAEIDAAAAQPAAVPTDAAAANRARAQSTIPELTAPAAPPAPTAVPMARAIPST